MKLKHFIILIFCALSSRILYAQVEPGTIHAEAIKIDFDKWHHFKEGFAVIQKGTAFGVINGQGRFVIPYGKYKDIPYGFVNGYCMVANEKNLLGFVDTTGEIVIPCQYMQARPFSKDGYAFVMREAPFYMAFVDKKGKEIKTTLIEPYSFESSDRGLTDKGIVDKSGKVLVPIKSNSKFHGFSEGLAAVARLNEFGELKWGFIDINGKTVIPFQYSNEPSDFSAGRAVITPANTDEFDYGFINKKGDIVIKAKADDKSLVITGRQPYREHPFSKSGWAASCIGIKNGGDILIDTAGTFYDFTKLLKLVNPKVTITKATIISINQYDVMFRDSNKGLGISQVNGEIILPPASYIELGHFDPVSGLAKAHVQVKNYKYVKGYVNTKGEFLIVQKSQSDL